MALALVIIAGGLREDWVPGTRYRALQRENKDLRALLEKAVAMSEDLTRKDEEATRRLWQLVGRQPIADELEDVEQALRRRRPSR